MNEKTLALRLVQEFDGASVAIAGRLAQPYGRFAQRLILLRRERRGGRFFEIFW